MKANFKVDPDFPAIDGIGHSDKIDYFDVKGGGATNTTLLDPLDDSLHCAISSRSVAFPVSTDLAACRYDPDLQVDNQTPAAFWQASSPNCLNGIYVGDNYNCRGSDRVVMSRLEVSGSLHRPAGSEYDPFSNIAPAPKCFVAIVLDQRSDGAAPPNAFQDGDTATTSAVSGPFFRGGGMNPTATNHFSAVPFLGIGVSSRYRILAYDVVDFALSPETRYDWVDYANTWEAAGVPPSVTSTVLTREQYTFWRDVSLGFRFDIDLADVLCCFSGNGNTVASILDNSLHLYALCFDGVNLNAYVPHAFGTLSLKYMCRLWFRDYLVPKVPHAPAGADGDVVPDDEVPLAILADQSGRMAGDGTFLDRPVKRSKAAHGFFNFRPRAGDAMLFEDDPEFARLQRRKGDSRSRAPEIIQRRFKSHKYDDDEDFNAREGDRGGKRGKY